MWIQACVVHFRCGGFKWSVSSRHKERIPATQSTEQQHLTRGWQSGHRGREGVLACGLQYSIPKDP